MTKEKRKVTIENILTEDNVKDAFNRMVKELPNMTDMICIFRDHNGDTNWIATTESDLDKILAIIDKAHFALLDRSNLESENE